MSSSRNLNTPVLFLLFNRLNTTKLVFEEIKKAKPLKLYVAADGPRKEKPEESVKVNQVREFVLENIDWDCEVKTLFRNNNLGCKYAVSGAIDWFFENEEMGIILEDDCLPSQSFFVFCEDLLEKYMDDERIFLISGHNKQNTWKAEKYDYFFSHFGGIWGWASWRRAWKHYDVNMSSIGEFIEDDNFRNLLGPKLGRIRQKAIMEVTNNNIDTWDYQWGYARNKNSGLACVPTKSLIENIGFGAGATHTSNSSGGKVKRHEINFPLNENKFVIADHSYDTKFMRQYFLISRIRNKVKSFF